MEDAREEKEDGNMALYSDGSKRIKRKVSKMFKNMSAEVWKQEGKT